VFIPSSPTPFTGYTITVPRREAIEVPITVEQAIRFAVTGGVTAGNNDTTVNNLSFLSEASLLGKWHLRPNFSLRAGLEIMYVSSVAHASEQLDFIPVSNGQSAVVNGDSTFMGVLIGFEGYW